MDKITVSLDKSFELDLFVNNSILRIGKVNVPKEQKEEDNDKEKSIGVFDIESNGKEILFGFYNGVEYRYKVLKTAKDVEEVLNWLITVDVSYYYGDYDLPVSLSPFLLITNFSSLRKKNLSDNVYVLGESFMYYVRKMKNLYKIHTPNGESIAVNLLTFYAGSLFDSYNSFYQIIKSVFKENAFDENTLK